MDWHLYPPIRHVDAFRAHERQPAGRVVLLATDEPMTQDEAAAEITRQRYRQWRMHKLMAERLAREELMCSGTGE